MQSDGLLPSAPLGGGPPLRPLAALLGGGRGAGRLAAGPGGVRGRARDLHGQPVRQRSHPGLHQPGPLPGRGQAHRHQHRGPAPAARQPIGLRR